MSDETGAAPSAASPVATPTPTAQPASATATPAGGRVAAQTPTATPAGEPPKDRWPDILANARTKTRAEVESEFRQKYGWADEAARDPWGFTQRQLDQLAHHPNYEAHVLNYAAKLLNARRAQTKPPAQEPTPDVPVVDQSGNIVSYTYSDKGLKALRAYEQQASEGALSQRLAPLEQFVQQAQQREVQHAVEAQAGSTLTDLREQPYFKEHERTIKRVFAEHPEWGDNVHRAYLHVLTTEVIPSLSQREQQQVLATLQTKAAAGSVSPTGQAASGPPRFRTGNFKKDAVAAMEYYANHPEEAEAMAKR